MYTIVKKYGSTTEITEIEKLPRKKEIRISSSRKRKTVYGARRPDNIKRTKQICLRRVLTAIEDFGCPLLVTLTFKGDSSDASYANDSLRSFQVRLQNRYTNAQSIFIPELSPKGRIHFHGLLFNLPMHLGDKTHGRRVITYGTERETREIANLWREGYVDAKQTDGSIGLGYYLSKYISKSKNETLFNAMRLIRVSRGIRKESIFRKKIAKKLKLLYSQKEPLRVWEGENKFVGKIIKKTYQK